MDHGEMEQQSGGEAPSTQLGDMWGDDIKPERKVELEARLQAWAREADHGMRRGPFDGERLTGADVLWLAARTLAESADGAAIAERCGRLLQAKGDAFLGFSLNLSGLHLERANLHRAQLKGALLSKAHLEGADLFEAHLEGAVLNRAQLTGVNLRAAHLEGADLFRAHLEGANLHRAHLEGADLFEARLEGTILRAAHLEGASLNGAHLEGADLRAAHLEGQRVADADLERIGQALRQGASDVPTVLPPTDLRLAFFDRATQLRGATLGDADLGYVRVADARWGEVNLAVVNWPARPILRDEREARAWMPQPSGSDAQGKRSTWQERRIAQQAQRAERLDLYRAATRANRQLATVLRTQGLHDVADRFASRARVLQRIVLRLQGKRIRWATRSAGRTWGHARAHVVRLPHRHHRVSYRVLRPRANGRSTSFSTGVGRLQRDRIPRARLHP